MKEAKLIFRCSKETKDYVDEQTKKGEYENRSEFLRALVIRHKMKTL